MMGLDYTAIITAIVGLIGGGWLFNLYSAKPRKTSIELENVRKAMEEMNGKSYFYHFIAINFAKPS